MFNSTYDGAGFPGLIHPMLGPSGALSDPPPVLLKEQVLKTGSPAFQDFIFQPFSLLKFKGQIKGYAPSDVVCVRFNSDAGANYSCRFHTSAPAGGTWTDNPLPSQNQIQLGLATTLWRNFEFVVGNAPGSKHGFVCAVQIGTADAVTMPTIHGPLWAQWLGTAAIVSASFFTLGGGNMFSGSSITLQGWYPAGTNGQ